MPPAPRATPAKALFGQKLFTPKRLFLWVGGACVPPACGCGCLFVLIVVVAVLPVALGVGIIGGAVELGKEVLAGVQAAADTAVGVARDIGAGVAEGVGNIWRSIFP